VFSVDLQEWERFGYQQGLTRPEIEAMSLGEYLLRRQARMKDAMETIRLETLPIVNCLSEDEVTVSDFFGEGSHSTRDEEELKAFRHDVSQHTDLVDDWSLLE